MRTRTKVRRMSRLHIESIDLAAVARDLRAAHGAFVRGDVVGKTALRDTIVQTLACSALEAEQLVDTMIGRGFVVPDRRDDGSSGWSIPG